MTDVSDRSDPDTTGPTHRSTSAPPADRVGRIVAAVDDRLAGRDAAVLLHHLAAVTGAEAMLIAIEHDNAPLPDDADSNAIRQDTMRMLGRIREELVPEARIVAGRDPSVVRGLEQTDPGGPPVAGARVKPPLVQPTRRTNRVGWRSRPLPWT